jgi:hypothetical protein
MALLFFDGFDHAGQTTAIHASKYDTFPGTGFALSNSQARTGTTSLWFSSTSLLYTAITKLFPVNGNIAIVGVALRMTTTPSSLDDLLHVREGTIVHVAVSVNSSRQLVVRRGTTTLATGTTVLALNTWYYVELKTTIHDTTGAYEVRIDGVSEGALTATGVDTNNAGTSTWNNIELMGPGGNTFVDDFYICDGSGAAPRNTFLGPVKVETLYPQTDAVAAGSNAGLTPSTGTDHGALVDENPPNTTDYNSSPTVGLKDTYNYPSLTLTGSILGIQTNLYVAKSDTAARQVCAVVRAGGVDYDGANVSPLTTFSYFSEVRAQNPNTSNDWTSSDIASLQAGMKVTA